MGMIKIIYQGNESPIAFSSLGGKPSIVKVGDEVEVSQEAYDQDLKNDPRWVLSAGQATEPVKAKSTKGAK